MTAVRDPYLDLPLDGVRLIEASAGTGKTYTLATLVTRLVVERGLRIGQILAVTFTDAATQELRKRIRERLQLTLALIDAPPADDEGSEATLTRQLLQSHRARSEESDDALRHGLRQATLDTDLAAIFTIHGFCARVLREHALESGHAFDAPELLANDRDLRAELAADLWRIHAQDATIAGDLGTLWPNHEALAEDLRVLLREPVLLPADVPLPPDPKPALLAAGADLADAHQRHGEAFFADLLAAVDGKVLNGNSYRTPWINALWQQLTAWCEAADFTAPLDERIARLTAEALQGKANKGKDALVPASPMSAEISAYLHAVQAQAEFVARRRIALLHRIRDDARARLAQLKQQRRLQTYDDLIDGVADALDGGKGDALAAQLRSQYRVALVDEFQDTDARQWAIFNRVFGEQSGDPALFLIGDPKQAIYGFRGGDVHTYLDAGTHAIAAPPLSQNFRSRPAVLQAIAALYAQAGRDAFIDPRIEFREVEAGGKRTDQDYLRDGTPAPALTVWQAPPPLDDQGKRKPWRAGEARTLVTNACVAEIHGVLSKARNGKAMVAGKPVQPGDIAVLVRSHHEATMVQQALVLAGIPAVAAGKQSLFATAEARELHVLLLALLHAGDDGRLRAALSTVLVGVDAAGIDNLETDADAHRDHQQEAMGWRERLLRGGPLALVGDLCAANAERLLGLLDGERRMSNYLQLAELLQEAQANELGLHGLVDWLGHRIATADANDEAQLLRLESDARRVQIVTLHKSKGLEYPLVFLPFVGIGRQDKAPSRCCVVHDAHDGRRLRWNLHDEADWKDATDAWKQEQRAEDARLLYVGLTRAEHALWIATGDFFAHDRTPLSKMLGDAEALAAAGIAFDDSPTPVALPRLPAEHTKAIPPARSVTRRLSHDWWVYSFSQLAKADAGIDADTASSATLPASGGNDEPDGADDVVVDTSLDPRFAGNRYGVALHAALEHADFGAWQGWQPGDAAPADESTVIADALRDEGYGADVLDDGLALTTQLVGQTLTVPLPEGVRLCDVPASERRPEIEFQFSLQPVQVDALLRLLHAYGVVRERHGFGLRQKLEGLMTGLVDLTYRHAGKWYVLDYKSNRLPGYDDAAMAQAMAHSEYDLQALIYTLALHRWLRFRLRDGYDYARDFGGIRYVFCRGLDAGRIDSPGIHAQRFSPELVDALDALFGQGDAQGVAA
jgi:exodeoxyribonuclease V beta subunit